MLISWILIIFFLLVILGEMYFIGKYISITQEIFSNKTFATFSLGAVVYIFITFILFLPFATIDLSNIYFAIIVVIKDFFTIIFLITRREKFKGMSFNWKALLFMLLSAVVLPLLYEFVCPYIFKTQELAITNNYQTWTKFFEPAFTHLTKFKYDELERFMFAPLASVMVFSFLSALLLNFYNKDQLRGYFLAFFVTIGFLLLFNYKLNIYDMIGPAMILFLVLSSYNLIMFSRRRYGSLFGIIVGATWSVMPQLFWTVLILAFATSITYSFLKKPRALVFTIQLVAPMAIVAAFWIGDFSKALALTLSILGGAIYILIFILNRVHIIEKNSKLVSFINYAWPIAVILTMLTLAIIFGFKLDNVTKEILITNNNLFDSFDIDIFELVQNIIYYVLLLFLAFYTVILIIRKERILKLKLIIIMTLFTFLFGYNPGFQAIMAANDWYQEYQLVRLAAIAPLLIIGIAQAKRIKSIESKNLA